MASLSSIGMSIFSTASEAIREKADNLARIGDPNASAKIVQVGARTIAGESAGIEFIGIQRATHKPTVDRIVEQSGVLGKVSKESEYSVELMGIFGQPGDERSLGEIITNMTNAIHNLVNNPVSSSNQDQVIRFADNLAKDINRISKDIQSIRLNASNEISDSISKINSILKNIVNISESIAITKNKKGDTISLEDERDVLVKELGSLIDIKTSELSDGKIRITTQSGKILLDGNARELSYLAPVTIDPSFTYSGSTIPGIYLESEDITSSIKGGAIAALIEMRDDTLPAYQDNIDELTIQLRDAINAVHNLGTGYPAVNQLNGSRVIPGADNTARDAVSFSGQGTVRFAVVDAAGKFVASADLDLSTFSTIGDLRTAINGIAGMSAGYNSDGSMYIKADVAANGVGIVSLSNESNNVSNRNFSHYFGFNDFYKTGEWYVDDGASKVGVSQSLEVRSDLLSSPKYLSQMRLSTAASPSAGDVATRSGGSQILQEMISTFNGNVTFNTSGKITGRATRVDNYASIIIQDVATRTDNAKTATNREENNLDFWKSRLENYTKIDENKEMADFMAFMELYRYGGVILEVSKKMNEILMDIIR